MQTDPRRVLASPRPYLGMITPAEPELEEPEAIVGEIMLVDDTANQVLVLLEQLLIRSSCAIRSPVSKFNFNSRRHDKARGSATRKFTDPQRHHADRYGRTLHEGRPCDQRKQSSSHHACRQ